jgi:Dolichyl-phosphate-mannose-protein mannosyltransferase
MSRADKILALLLAVCVAILAAQRIVPGVCGVFHDDGVYVATAKALAEGDGYRLMFMPGEPVQTKYPILYPALLALIWLVYPSFPDNLVAMQAFSVACGALTLGVCFLYLVQRGYASRSMALGSMLLCAAGPTFSFFAARTATEMPFALATVLTLWVVDAPNAARDRRWAFAVGFLLGIPFLLRTIGIAILAGALLSLALRKALCRWILAGALLPVVAWGLWVAIFSHSADAVDRYATSYFAWWWAEGVGHLWKVASMNFVSFMVTVPLMAAEGLVPWLREGPTFLFAIAMGCALLSGIFQLVVHRRPLGFVLAAYVLVVMVWPWRPSRFIVPILPLAIACALERLRQLTLEIGTPKLRQGIGLAAIAVVAALNLSETWSFVWRERERGYPFSRVPQEAISWESHLKLFAWIREHVPERDVIGTGLDPMLYLYTGRRAVQPFIISGARLFYSDEPSLGSVSDATAIVDRYGVKWIVRQPMPGLAGEESFDRLLEQLASRRCLAPALTVDGGSLVIYRWQCASGALPLPGDD